MPGRSCLHGFSAASGCIFVLVSFIARNCRYITATACHAALPPNLDSSRVKIEWNGSRPWSLRTKAERFRVLKENDFDEPDHSLKDSQGLLEHFQEPGHTSPSFKYIDPFRGRGAISTLQGHTTRVSFSLPEEKFLRVGLGGRTFSSIRAFFYSPTMVHILPSYPSTCQTPGNLVKSMA